MLRAAMKAARNEDDGGSSGMVGGKSAAPY